MKVYLLQLPFFYKLLVFGVLVIFSVVGLALIANYVVPGFLISRPPPLLFTVAWILMVAWNWYVVLGIPYEIRVESQESIEFISLTDKIRLPATDIRSIKPLGGNIYSIKYAGGRIFLFSQFTGFHELIALIKKASPDTEIVGM